jgi:thiol:disulfide interchange protein DsbD
MVEQVWPKVQGLLQSEFVIVSLYVDEKKELPADLKEVYRTRWSGVEKEIETYGDMWSAFEIETFNSNSQPLYVIIDPMTNGEEELMNEPLAGMVSEEEFRNWLKEGIRLYGLK